MIWEEKSPIFGNINMYKKTIEFLGSARLHIGWGLFEWYFRGQNSFFFAYLSPYPAGKGSKHLFVDMSASIYARWFFLQMNTHFELDEHCTQIIYISLYKASTYLRTKQVEWLANVNLPPPNVSLSEIRRLSKALWKGNLMVHKRLFKAGYFWGVRYVRGGRLTSHQELSRRTLRCDVLSFHVAMRWAPWRRANNFLELLMSQALQADVVSYTLARAWALWWQKTGFYWGMFVICSNRILGQVWGWDGLGDVALRWHHGGMLAKPLRWIF